MKTSRPISTICYLTSAALKMRLERLFDEHQDLLVRWAFIQHQPEENDTKEHIHLIIVPCSTIDTDRIWFKEAFLTEYNGETVTSVMPWTASKDLDWYLYCKHDPDYLASKGLQRKFHYSRADFFTNDEAWLDDLEAMGSKQAETPIDRIIFCALNGYTVFDAMRYCKVSYGAMKSFMECYKNVNEHIKETVFDMAVQNNLPIVAQEV